jgi:hypothetical protein
VKRPRAIPAGTTPSGGEVHYDAGDPRRLELRLELRRRVEDDLAARDRVLRFLLELLGPKRK